MLIEGAVGLKKVEKHWVKKISILNKTKQNLPERTGGPLQEHSKAWPSFSNNNNSELKE